MIDFRRCEECGASAPPDSESCPHCGRALLTLRDALGGKRALTHGGSAAVAVLFVLALPDGALRGPWQSLLEASALSVGLAPLLFALGWLAWRKSRRDPACHARKIEALETRIGGLEADLRATDLRIDAARTDLDGETRAKAAQELVRELEQDRRLRRAQRRLARSLEEHRERLQVERFRGDLSYYEACRDAQLDVPDLARELQARITQLRHELDDTPSERWERAIDDAELLCRQLSRGVQRLHAARRLDPLGHADLPAPGDEAELEAPHEGALDELTEMQLERIDRGFSALEELAGLIGDSEASGLRVRVDDELMAALGEAVSETVDEAQELEEEEAPERISVERL